MSLNLYTRAEGLEDTHVTWRDIEEVLQEELNTTAVFGKNRQATNIGDGKGFLSRIILIDADWQNVQEGENLPKRFVAKLCSLMNLHGVVDVDADNEEKYFSTLEANTKKMHNSECIVYDQMRIHRPDTPSIRVFCTRKYTTANPLKGMIIMEFIENLSPVGIYQNLCTNSMKQVLRASAKLSAMSLKFTKEEKEQFGTKPFREIFGDFFQEENKPMLEKMRTFDGGKIAAQTDKLEKMIHVLHDFDYYDRIPHDIGMNLVLCHGDLWSSNVMWKHKCQEYQLAAIIDYQTSHFGSPAADILRIICASMEGKERQNKLEELVRYYYEQFIEELDGEEAPFTYEQLLESCKRLMPLAAYFILMMIVTLLDIFCKDNDENKRQTALEIGVEKVERLFEDVFYYEERNREFRKEGDRKLQ